MSRLPIITISRQYGSGGREVGKILAAKFGIPYYDNELITLAAEESGFDPEMFANADKDASSSLLFSLSMYSGVAGAHDMPLGDRVFLIQSDIIREVAKKGPCVIVGRCADHILYNVADRVSVFLHAPVDWRVTRAVAQGDLPAAKAKETIDRIDKKRSVYYTHFTGKKWSDSSNYDMTINTSRSGMEGTAALIEELVHRIIGE